MCCLLFGVCCSLVAGSGVLFDVCLVVRCLLLVVSVWLLRVWCVLVDVRCALLVVGWCVLNVACVLFAACCLLCVVC